MDAPERFAETSASPFLTPEHLAFRDMLRRFVATEIEPFAAQWDEAGEFPRELYLKAASIGLLQLGFPEEYGGIPCDRFMSMIAAQELARAGAGGVSASLKSHTIGAPPIVHGGSDELKARVLPDILAGKKISALAITEPGGGSDVANLRTTARREGDHYVVKGEKTFITSGMRADYYTVAVRTGGEGAGGVSLLLIERDTPGFSRTPLKKMGWWASDTATLYFDDCRVPVANLIGTENAGFKLIMKNFNSERLGLAAGCTGFARVCVEEAIAYARERKTFGKRLADHQVIRHKIVDMAQRVAATQAMLEMLIWRLEQGDNPVAEVCMCKNQATQTMAYCASEAVQIFGGAGFMRGPKVERIYREVKVNAIGGGTEEIMKDLASRQMGL
ncbi:MULTISPECIES: acyl-CoA dehydrogenase family protein [unclassified Afipia]|uniref:acyl-CoA dehydrogenase family protein n=1 Tax=unclassified Afipia TaxID=2642050 RepID=UPI000464D725|nr:MULTISPECIES: acyl-CoA dehydrogenase family protein [unclassified Afipia]MAH68798.1 acyl-CoA dehydrogenase [Afipia sp.]OUX62139.1 MAG: acyl-CoA dehydrogenase [Afipia sp. TMED4]HAO42857.1 acyl-CoA dehydrogenase [Afipia sp.]HBF53540.1 acyl-CoA dehydrogenase [Afipia sp.]HCX15722.1 acyl-CoA dehydrogenase [Afipia sp.]